ncbi:MAG: CDC27 family protein [Crocinitomicaceae bacterium]
MKLILSLILTLSILPAFAYSINPPDSTLSLVKKAEVRILISDGRKFYNTDNYRSALVKFREALTISKTNAEANYWVAECHLGLNNFDVALKYAKKAEALDTEVEEELYYVLGLAHHKLGHFSEAINDYRNSTSRIAKSRIRELRIYDKIEECERGLRDSKSPLDIQITTLDASVNSKHDDYGAVLSNDGKSIFFSSRKAQNTGGGFSSGDSKYFSDIFISDWDDKTEKWLACNNLDKRIKQLNTEGFDDIAFLSHDGLSLYLSINTEGIMDTKVNTQSTDIFVSKLDKDNNWSNPKPIGKSINSIGFEASPSFTADGNTMYFVSERISGEGKADIWTAKLEKGRWSKPENVGKTINTPYQETTVFVSENGEYLFFSSDGHKGYGGYDVYVSKNINGEWSEPVNLGFPINNVTDETHFVYYPKYQKGYYSKLSTKENGGFGYRDIFEINLSNFDLEKLF